ncbi:MAG: hypothetical protein ABTB30_12085, partial [Clostridia bacterium]
VESLLPAGMIVLYAPDTWPIHTRKQMRNGVVPLNYGRKSDKANPYVCDAEKDNQPATGV